MQTPPYRNWTHAKPYSQRINTTGLSVLVAGYDVALVLLRKLGFNLPLLKCIVDVFPSRSNPKMRRVYTKRIIPAWAVVKKLHSVGNCALHEYPCSTMGRSVLSANQPRTNHSISMAVFGGRPKPTRFGLFYLGPKPLWKRCRKTLRSQVFDRNLVLHNQYFWLCHALGCANNAEALSY